MPEVSGCQAIMYQGRADTLGQVYVSADYLQVTSRRAAVNWLLSCLIV